MIITVLLAVQGLAFPPLATLFMRCYLQLPLASPRFFSMWALGAGIGTAGSLLTGVWPLAASYGASCLLALALWRRSRKLVPQGAGG